MSKKLAQPESVYWSGVPLRQSLESFSRTQRVAVLIDRRVDPGQKLDLALHDVPVGGILRAVAKSRNVGVCFAGPVAYFGPPRVTSRLRTLAELRREDVRRLRPEGVRKFMQSERIRWDDLAMPRDLLGQLAADNGLEISGLEQVPHDLWASADLPLLALVDRLTLITSQFDLTFEIVADGKSVALVPVPDEVALVRSYPGGRRAEQLAKQWAALVPDSQISVMGTKIHVKGRVEDHERIAEARRSTSRPTTRRLNNAQEFGQKRFTIRGTRGQLGPILEQLGPQLKAQAQVELRIDRAAIRRAGVSLDQLVSIDVAEATLEELLGAVLKGTGCTFRQEGNVVEIRPAE